MVFRSRHFQKVWLCESPEIRFGNDGIYITTSKQEDGWQVTVKAEMLRPVGTPLGGIRIKNTILDKDGKEVASYESDACGADISCIPEAVRVKGVSYSLTAQTMTVKDPELWDITSPVLYTMASEILVDGGCVQRVSQKFGFRTIKFKCDSGFYLNGRHVKLHGSCEHHDNGCLGAVSNPAAIRRRFKSYANGHQRYQNLSQYACRGVYGHR